MKLTINEVKIQAKKLFKALKTNPSLLLSKQKSLLKMNVSAIDELQLKHCLGLSSLDLGFSNWQIAHSVLSGSFLPVETIDMGKFFIPKAVGALLINGFQIIRKLK
jgi:hypothetical protein